MSNKTHHQPHRRTRHKVERFVRVRDDDAFVDTEAPDVNENIKTTTGARQQRNAGTEDRQAEIEGKDARDSIIAGLAQKRGDRRAKIIRNVMKGPLTENDKPIGKEWRYGEGGGIVYREQGKVQTLEVTGLKTPTPARDKNHLHRKDDKQGKPVRQYEPRADVKFKAAFMEFPPRITEAGVTLFIQKDNMPSHWFPNLPSPVYWKMDPNLDCVVCEYVADKRTIKRLLFAVSAAQ
jgi:hypothetical protein